METPTVKPGKAAAVVTHPYAAVATCHHSHGYIVRQPLGRRQHPDGPVLKSNESIAVCADPKIADLIGEEGSYRNAKPQRLQASRRASEQSALREHPHIALPVFDERERTVCVGDTVGT